MESTVHSYHLGKFRAEWPPSSICGGTGVRIGGAGLHSRTEPSGMGWVRSQGSSKGAPLPVISSGVVISRVVPTENLANPGIRWVISRELGFFHSYEASNLNVTYIESFRTFFENSVLQ